jgi:hypothetical protein
MKPRQIVGAISIIVFAAVALLALQKGVHLPGDRNLLIPTFLLETFLIFSMLGKINMLLDKKWNFNWCATVIGVVFWFNLVLVIEPNAPQTTASVVITIIAYSLMTMWAIDAIDTAANLETRSN